MTLFDQKPRFASRPLEWLITGGHGTQSAAERFLVQLSQRLDENSDERLDLVSLRDDFRKLMNGDEAIPVLQRRLRYGGALYRSVSVWLLSKSASRFNLLGIDNYCEDSSPTVRKHVAKALRRLEAQELLQSMAAQNPDDKSIQWFATFKTDPKLYRDRLANFAKNLDPKQAVVTDGPSRMPLWFRDEYCSGSPPKNIEYMREILRRIQALVHG